MDVKVMVVDDSLTMRKVIKGVLLQLGIKEHNIGLAQNGIDALGQLKVHSYDIILTDWNMPKMNGLSLVQNLRHLPKHKHTPIIMITTEGGKEEVITALKSGINNYIVKPFNAQTLKSKLEPIFIKLHQK